MTEDQLVEKINSINVWKKGDKRAPHKPLLLLLALSLTQQRKQRLTKFSHIEKTLTELLIEFGPQRKNYYPEEPFKRLPGDGIWELSTNNGEAIDKPIHYSKSELRQDGVLGGFTIEVYNLIKSNSNLLSQISNTLLSSHFPNTIHQDIIDTIGLDLDIEYQKITQEKRKRDPKFRGKILEAYNYRCAVCGFDVRIGNTPIALEAAHIKWHQAGGPDIESNGLALCSLHHKLLDRGAFGLSNEFKVIVSDKANGHTGFQEWIMDFEGKELSAPRKDIYTPDVRFAEWHIREVFQGSFN